MEQGFYLFLLVLAGTPVWILAMQAAITRLGVSRRSNQAAAMLSSALATVPVGALLWAVHLRHLNGDGLRTALAYAFFLYALLAYSYFHLFNMGETARRVRVLMELKEHGGMKMGELKSFYNTASMLDRRLERLVSLGQVRVDGERIILGSKKLYFVAAVLDIWCRFIGLSSLRNPNSR